MRGEPRARQRAPSPRVAAAPRRLRRDAPPDSLPAGEISPLLKYGIHSTGDATCAGLPWRLPVQIYRRVYLCKSTVDVTCAALPAQVNLKRIYFRFCAIHLYRFKKLRMSMDTWILMRMVSISEKKYTEF